MKVSFATNHQGDPSFFPMVNEWERDTLPELPPPRDYAEYARARREQAGCDLYTPLEFAR